MIEITKLGENAEHPADFSINRPSGHPCYLLLMVKTPASFWTQEGWNYTTNPCVILFKPQQLHRYCATQSVYINNWVHFNSEQSIVSEHFSFGVPIQLNNPDIYYDLFHILCNEFYGASNHRDLILHDLMMVLLHKIGDESNTQKYPALYYEFIALRKEIYTHPEFDWSVQCMANKLNISTGYLQAVYQKFFSQSCMRDVINSRIQYSCEILTSSNKSMEEVASLCGYHYTEHFIRQFKMQMGITPGQYRKKFV